MNQAPLNQLTRRDFAARAAKTFLGLSVLPIGVHAATAAKTGKARNVIYLYLAGGMSHIDTFDPKPENKEVQGPVGTLKTNVPGIIVSEYLPRLARQADQLAIVRSLTSTQGAHEQGTYFMHSSYEKRGTIQHPGMGSWILKLDGLHNERLPGNVSIGGGSRGIGSGFMESRYAPLAIGDPAKGLQDSKRPKYVTESTFRDRLDLAEALDARFERTYDLKEVRAYKDMYADALRLMKSEDLDAFDLNKEPRHLKEAYGENGFGQGCLLARRLIENDVRFVEVTSGGWDTHTNNFVTVPEKAAELDQALSALLTDLKERGLLDDTLVVVATEFGRTPEINSNDGRDHSPTAFTGLLAGGGIAGGQVYGKTDEAGKQVVENQIKIPDFNATIAYALGLPLDEIVTSPSARPFTVAHKGTPVMDLFG
ncbi:MAG: hypothetical protein ACI9TH_000317 [Kiritimatiellia bacterium]|jgi:hypothetical protein